MTQPAQPWWLTLLVTIGPAVIKEVGASALEVVKHRQKMAEPCVHGHPGGRMCSPCWDIKMKSKI